MLSVYLRTNLAHTLITMKITVLKQTAKSILGNAYKNFEDEIDSVKWYLWHGNVFRALDLLETIDEELYVAPDEQEETKKSKKDNGKDKLQKLVEEFDTYIQNNKPFIINYGEKYRCGETISSSFAESTVDEVISRRMVKKQHMRWTQKGAHLLLQLRVKTLNHDLRKSFVKWYPRMEEKEAILPLVA